METIGKRAIRGTLSAVLLSTLASAAGAQIPSGCYEVCAASCLKPIAIPDRWDDFSVPTAAGWSGNGIWDQENFTDSNANGLHDPAEPFIDGSSIAGSGTAGPLNGQYDEEFYDPYLTGLLASKDLGHQLSLKSSLASGPIPKVYYAVDLPGSSGSADFRWNIGNCNPSVVGPGDVLHVESSNLTGPIAQGMRDLINRDLGAHWDESCQCVILGASDSGDHPRTLVLAVADPRIALTPSMQGLHIVKLVGFFLESQQSNGTITGRLVTAQAAMGTPCNMAGAGFFYDCAVPTERSTWGELKSRYR